jgi:hypothetical protein
MEMPALTTVSVSLEEERVRAIRVSGVLIHIVDDRNESTMKDTGHGGREGARDHLTEMSRRHGVSQHRLPMSEAANKRVIELYVVSQGCYISLTFSLFRPINGRSVNQWGNCSFHDFH